MSVDALALAVLALAPEGTALGEVPGEDPPLPWRSLRVRFPEPSLRSDASTPLAVRVRVQVTVAAASDRGVLIESDAMSSTIEGVRPVVEGWSCGPLLLVGSSDPYLSEATSHSSNRRVTVGHLSFVFTAARLPS